MFLIFLDEIGGHKPVHLQIKTYWCSTHARDCSTPIGKRPYHKTFRFLFPFYYRQYDNDFIAVCGLKNNFEE